MPFSSNQYNNNNIHTHLSDSHYILIVDDEPDILSVVRRILEEYDFKMCCFTKPYAALEHYKMLPNSHDLVISDLQMPNINGLEFIRKVKEINSNVKAILMTSSFQTSDSGLLLLPNSNPLSSSSFLNLKIDEFIPKPFSIQKLVELIRKHVSLKGKQE
jgi:CheY-like chemotaxis protein